MPVTPTYPGVYIEEIPSGVRTIVGVATSITAFIGRTLKGPADEPVRVQNYGEFDRTFGGLWAKSTLSYAVQQYFLNGGKDAIIVRVHNAAEPSTISISGLELEASGPGEWGKTLRATIDLETKDPSDATLFNLTIEQLEGEAAAEDPQEPFEVVAIETLRNLSITEGASRYYQTIIREEATLVNLVEGAQPLTSQPAAGSANAQGGSDGENITDDQISSDDLQDERKGLYALDKADLFNLLCIPPLTRDTDVGVDTTLAKAAKYCKDRRAMLLVDPPSSWNTIAQAKDGINELRGAIGNKLGTNVAVYFPRLRMADPLQENRTEEFVPCGAVAGIFAVTDTQRGVWKAPAGIDASLVGVRELSYKMTDGENGQLNQLGLNAIRIFPVYGRVIWGTRTLVGADQLASEWKYVPVRRLALFLQESLYRGTQWVVFEPNDEPLWAQIRLNVGTFMNGLFRQGAFEGKSPKEAYFVKCDSETTTPDDQNRGIVNIIVGFAPLKPAEFVILKFQQMTKLAAA
jgi:hypothetical protein